MSTLVRFAPSPTGYLHVGNARTAIINWLFTMKQGGQFMLRLDDTDEERSTEEFAQAIEEDLSWLGLTWQKFDKQSDRGDRYLWGFETLKEKGRLYPCYETPEELDIKRKVQLSRGKPPIYDRAALELTDEQKQKYEAEGRVPHWRFKLEAGEIKWQDLGRGDASFQAENLTDPVLFRADMKPIYMLASTVDDIDHGVTHVIRGEDHITNTAIMIQICQALGGTPPTFAHVSMLSTLDGEGLSKRKGSLSLRQLRSEGIEPMAITSMLSKLGTSDPVEARLTMEQLVQDFDMVKFSRATPKFDLEELKKVNARLVHMMPFDQVEPRLKQMGIADIDESVWAAIRPNLESIQDLKDWWAVINGPVDPKIEDSEFAAMAANLLPQEPWDTATWGHWTQELKQQSGRKGRELFMPLRLALTGKEHGPELANLLPLIGYEKAANRLQGKQT